ncbi:MAG TPA: hypothetical protein DCE20_09130, partial [Gammaproteobacteria bacterium]|nr:hypothetical protein [Gammaproteobacteria bacterium]
RQADLARWLVGSMKDFAASLADAVDCGCKLGIIGAVTIALFGLLSKPAVCLNRTEKVVI